METHYVYMVILHTLIAPFKGARLTQNEMDWNSAMSSVRVSVEWIFKDIITFNS